MTSLRAKFDGRVLVPEGPVDLPKGRTLEIRILDHADAADVDTSHPLLQAARAGPYLTEDDVRELERAIDQGKLASPPENPLDEGR